jgi:hypothetical protein
MSAESARPSISRHKHLFERFRLTQTHSLPASSLLLGLHAVLFKGLLWVRVKVSCKPHLSLLLLASSPQPHLDLQPWEPSDAAGVEASCLGDLLSASP